MGFGNHFALNLLDISYKMSAAFLAPLEAASAPASAKTRITVSLASVLSLSIINPISVFLQKILPVFVRERPETPFGHEVLVRFFPSTFLFLRDSCYLVL